MLPSFEIQFANLKKLIDIERPNPEKLPPDYNFRNIYGYSLLELGLIVGDEAFCMNLIHQKHANWSLLHPTTHKPALFYAINHLCKRVAQTLIGLGANLVSVFRADLVSAEAKALFDTLTHQQLHRIQNRNWQMRGEPGELDNLILAAETGNLPAFRAWSNALHEHAAMILESAVVNDQINIVKECLRQGLRLNSNPMLMHEAARYGAIQSLSLLLSAKYSWHVNREDRDGNTPLLLAARNHQLSCVRMLLRNGAHYLYPDDAGRTLFYFIKAPSQRKSLGLTQHQLTRLMQEHDAFLRKIQHPLPSSSHFNFAQAHLIHVLRYYLELHRRDLAFFCADGYCEGLSFFWHYLNALRPVFQKPTLLEVIEDIISWDGSISALAKAPKNAKLLGKSLGEVIEIFLHIVTIFQIDKSIPGLPKKQGDRAHQLGLLKSQLVIDAVLPNANYRMSANELCFFLEYASLCEGLCLDILAQNHASTIFINGQRNIHYYNANLPEGVLYSLSIDALLSLITFGHIAFCEGDFSRTTLEHEHHTFCIRAYRLRPKDSPKTSHISCYEQCLFAYAKQECESDFLPLFDLHYLNTFERYNMIIKNARLSEANGYIGVISHILPKDFFDITSILIEDKSGQWLIPALLDAWIARLIRLLPEYQEPVRFMRSLAQKISEHNALNTNRYFLSPSQTIAHLNTLQNEVALSNPLLFALFSLSGIMMEKEAFVTLFSWVITQKIDAQMYALQLYIERYELAALSIRLYYAELFSQLEQAPSMLQQLGLFHQPSEFSLAAENTPKIVL